MSLPSLNLNRVSALLASAALAVSLSFTSALAQDAKVVAKVGDVSITNAQLDQALADMGQQFQNFPESERRARALDSLIDIKLLAAKAEADGMTDEAELKSRLSLLQDRVKHNYYFQKKIQPAVTDADLKKRFDEEMKKIPRQSEVKARHILVKTEEEARAIIKELEGGADFIELAKTKSTGPSGPKGGDLGFFGKGRMVPEFEQAAFALEKGGITKEPVKTQFGYHIIKVDDVRDQPLPKFADTRNQLQQVMMAEAYAEAIKAARDSMGVEVLDESLKLPDEQ